MVSNEAEGMPEGTGEVWPEVVVHPVLPAPAPLASVPGPPSQADGGGLRPADDRRRGLHFRRPSPLRVIATGSTWVTASQLVTVGGNLLLTPFIIHGLGVERYGLFVLAATMTAFSGASTVAWQRRRTGTSPFTQAETTASRPPGSW